VVEDGSIKTKASGFTYPAIADGFKLVDAGTTTTVTFDITAAVAADSDDGYTSLNVMNGWGSVFNQVAGSGAYLGIIGCG